MSNSATTANLVRSVVAAGAAAPLAAATAHADGLDDQFLAKLSQDGVNIGPPDQLIALAHERCDDADLPRSGLFIPRFGSQPGPYLPPSGISTTNFKRWV